MLLLTGNSKLYYRYCCEDCEQQLKISCVDFFSKQIQDFGMNKFYIITNNEKDKNLEFTDRVVDYLGKRGGH